MAETANPRGALDNEASYAILFMCQARNSTYILSIHSSVWNSVKLEQLERLFEFWNGHYTRHTFWSCLIRCANMKWIRWVFLKIQSRHDSVHRRTRWYQYTPFQLRWSGGIKSCRSSCLELQIINIKLKKNQQKVPGPPPKLSASDWRTRGNFQHWFIVHWMELYLDFKNVTH